MKPCPAEIRSNYDGDEADGHLSILLFLIWTNQATKFSICTCNKYLRGEVSINSMSGCQVRLIGVHCLPKLTATYPNSL